MKRLLAVLVCLLMTAAPWVEAQDLFYSFNAPTGLVGRWKLCGDTSATSGCAASSSTTVYDSSGYGNNGTWNGTQSGTTGWYSAGHVGPNAGAFDGTTDYVTISNSTVYQTPNVTLSAWVYDTSIDSAYHSIMDLPYNLTGWTTPYAAWLLGVAPSGYPYSTIAHSGSQVLCTSSTAVAANTWTLLTATYDGTNLRVYINGVLNLTCAAASITYNAPTATPSIGMQSVYSAGSYFPGRIDDVRIYNRALSAGEIAQMYLAHN